HFLAELKMTKEIPLTVADRRYRDRAIAQWELRRQQQGGQHRKRRNNNKLERRPRRGKPHTRRQRPDSVRLCPEFDPKLLLAPTLGAEPTGLESGGIPGREHL